MDNYVYPLCFTHITNIVLNANVLLGHVAKIPSSSLQRTFHMENESVFNGILSVSSNRNQNQSSLITRTIYWFVYTYPCSVSQPCPTLCDPMGCSPSGSSVHGFSQARVLEWVAISFSRRSSWPRDWTSITCVSRKAFYHCYTWEDQNIGLLH